MSDVIIEKKNEVYLKLTCEPHILYELQPYFTFEVESAKFMSHYRNRNWDGQIRLLSVHTGEIYIGLLSKLIDKLKSHNYTYEFRSNKYYGLPFEVNENISLEGVKDYMNSICSIKPRDYQIEGVYSALKYQRKIILSATGSGKSLILYAISRYYAEHQKKILIIVPTTSLCYQIFKDFESYGWNAEEYCHIVHSGKEKSPLWVYVTLEDGSQYKFEGNQYINLINNKKKLAKDLNEDDEIDDRWISSLKKQ